jgi:hypothetical protein
MAMLIIWRFISGTRSLGCGKGVTKEEAWQDLRATLPDLPPVLPNTVRTEIEWYSGQ